MTKVKVLDLAREVGMEDDKLLMKLKRMGVKMKDKKSEEPEKAKPLSDERVIGRDSEKEIVEKRVKPTVIRRRTRNLEQKVEPAPAVEMPLPPPLVAEPKVQEKRTLKEAEEKVQEAEARLVATGAKGTKKSKAEGSQEIPLQAAAPTETTEVIPLSMEVKRVVPPPVPSREGEKRVETQKEGPVHRIQEPKIQAPKALETKPKGSVEEKKEIQPPSKKKLLDKEESEVLAGKKKGFVKKRRMIEERLLVEGEPLEEEVRVEKEGEPLLKPFRPVRKKVVVRESKKTEVTVPKAIKRIIRIAEMITVGDLAKRMGVKGGELIKKLMAMGILVNINQSIDTDVASLVASEFGYEVEKVSLEHEDLLERREDRPEQLKPRPPVVTIMGHVDHGKTMLLDAIRKTNVVDGEAGGITQHIGAYDVELEKGHVVFIDTPGHEAFTAMRARGAQVTDIVVLVVAADDGVMPQTREAIDHARAAKVPIVVAINKVDKPSANPEKVMKDLADYALIPEKWGGSTLFAEVSAKQKKGIKELLELILLQAEMLELQANPNKTARGVIIEAKLDRGRGPVATLLVQEGTLKAGDAFIAGSQYGRVRAMLNDRGYKIEDAPPSIPVEVVGFSDVPEAGEAFIVIPDERLARQISVHRQEKVREKELAKLSKVSLEELYDQIKKGEVKELNVIIKADVQGSIEAMREALKKLSTDTVKVNVLHEGVGGITETDVNLASASNAIIIGFNVRPVTNAQSLAESEHVDVRTYSIIYDAINDVKKALEGLLEPTYRERFLGRAQVLQVFSVHKIGMIAGSVVTDGKVVRGSHARLLRDNVIIYNGKIASLRRFKDDMKDCSQGLECGIGIENFNDVKLGDIIESYDVEEIRPQLV
jgi:translation initiation factor IF-2